MVNPTAYPLPASIETIIAYSGSRTVVRSARHALYGWLERRLLSEPRDQIVVVTGGCIGVDYLVAKFAHELGIYVHTVLPCDRSRVQYQWREFCDSFEEMPYVEPVWRGFKPRNQRMVDLATELNAAPQYPRTMTESKRSGTWQTVGMAERKPIPVDLLVLSELAAS